MRQIIVVPHDPAWASAFDAARDELHRAVGPALLEVHHIGSTAIPGIHAKPVIDMLAMVVDLAELDAQTLEVKRLGYEAKGEFGIGGRRYFRRDNAAGVRTHQVHAFAQGSSHLQRHLAFRDYMRAHPAAAEQYSQLKQKLAAAHPHDMEAYMHGKHGLIGEYQEKALLWVGCSPAT